LTNDYVSIMYTKGYTETQHYKIYNKYDIEVFVFLFIFLNKD